MPNNKNNVNDSKNINVPTAVVPPSGLNIYFFSNLLYQFST